FPWCMQDLLCALNLSFSDRSLVSSIFRGIGDDQCLIHVSRYKRILLVVNRVVNFFICFIQCTKINKFRRSYLAELSRVHRCFPFFLLHFFQGMCNHISSMAEAIEPSVVEGTQSAV